MIESVLVFNYHGKARLIKFYDAIYVSFFSSSLQCSHRPKMNRMI